MLPFLPYLFSTHLRSCYTLLGDYDKRLIHSQATAKTYVHNQPYFWICSKWV